MQEKTEPLGAPFFFSRAILSLWERACSRWHHLGLPGGPRRLNREQARSHNGILAFISWCKTGYKKYFFGAQNPDKSVRFI
ncbi:hypothetical protein C7A07_12065 [Pseudomonas fragi]|nr:hypothetical protein C7A07_12065 [Pseudomonas fragi]